MVTQKMAHKKASFWTEIFMTYDTTSVRSLPILVLSNKTEICNLAKKYTDGNICHTTCRLTL